MNLLEAMISTEDKLPEDGDECLVLTNDHEWIAMTYRKDYVWVAEGEKTHAFKEGTRVILPVALMDRVVKRHSGCYGVTHWFPLPAVVKEDDEGTQQDPTLAPCRGCGHKVDIGNEFFKFYRDGVRCRECTVATTSCGWCGKLLELPGTSIRCLEAPGPMHETCAREWGEEFNALRAGDKDRRR